MNKDFLEIKTNIEQGRPAPLYFFFGEETYFKDILIRTLIESLTQADTRDFNLDMLSGEETDGQAVVALASQFPMMAERRLMIVKSAERISPSGRKRIQQYLDAPLESTVLVFTAGSVDRRQSFWSALSKKSTVLDCRPLYENQAVDWVVREMGNRDRKIDKATAGFLVEKAGTSLWALHNEIEKILTYARDRKQITTDDVADVAGVSRKFTSWEFTDAVGSKSLDRALPILLHLLDEGESPAGLIMALARRIQLLLEMRALHDAGNSPARIAQMKRLTPFFSKLYIHQMKQYTLDELRLAVRALLDADVHIKTGYLPPNLILTLLVFDLIQGRRACRFYPVEEFTE